MIYSLYILNKSGGLIYQRDFNKGLLALTTNDYLILAGTIHGVHAIVSNITPPFATESPIYRNPLFANTNTSGLRSIETDLFNLFVSQTLTGIKFILITSAQLQGSGFGNDSSLNHNINNVEAVLRHVYILYSDYVMKNPFYSLEMPIRCDLFDQQLASYVTTL